MIKFEEGAVCYAFGHQWKEGDILPSDNGSAVKAHLPTFLKSSDFQLNEPREGWHIPKSELDTEEKYSKAVEVFGLFGFNLNKYHMGYSELVKVWRGIEIYHGELTSTNVTDGTKCTYTQLMAIGELKRKMLEREKSTPKITPDLTPHLTQENKRRNKSKQAYDILNGLDYEYDEVKQRWYKKEWV